MSERYDSLVDTVMLHKIFQHAVSFKSNSNNHQMAQSPLVETQEYPEDLNSCLNLV